MARALALVFSLVLALVLPGALSAQGAKVAFGSGAISPDQPVEVTSDDLSVKQDDGTAVFTGNVVIGQGQMRLAAPRVLVVYNADQSKIERLEATGGVTLVSGQDAAEAQRADYNLISGNIEMKGNVMLVQGENVMTGQTLLVDTVAGTARMSGRVKTVLQPKPKAKN